MHRNRVSFFALLILSLVVGIIVAQDVLQCDELIENFLEELDENCSEFDMNNACYGLNTLTAEFLNADDLPQDYFTKPADIAELLEMSNMTTTVFDPDEPEWGIAVLNIQANIPNTIPGQAVKVLLMGGMELENGVEPDEAFISERSVSLTLAENGVVRYFPRSDSDFVQNIPTGADILADARSTNGLWVRVAYDDIPGWIAVSTLEDSSRDRLVGLPMIDEDTQSPMQSFYFETGISQARCREAPTILVVQGPEDYEVDITANGAQIRIGSTIILRTNINAGDDSASMEVVTLSGVARVFPDTENEVVVPAGEILVSCLASEEQDLGIDDLADDREVLACETREMTEDEIAEFDFIKRVSARVMNYEVEWPPDNLVTPTSFATEVPTEEATATILPTITLSAFACAPREDWAGVHVVASGQSLSGIAASYGTDMFALASANCIANPDSLSIGETLIVPFIPTPTPLPTLTPVPPIAPPIADLQVQIVASNTAPLENDALTFTITATNVGQIGLNSITVTDTLNGLTGRYAFGVPSASSGTYTFGTGTWTISSLGVGSSASVIILATVRPTSAGLALNSTASGSVASPSDSNTGNNAGLAIVNVGYGAIIVNNTSEAEANDGVCTLREAITSANNDGLPGNNAIGECRTGNGADTIILQAAGPYNVTSAYQTFVNQDIGLPLVTDDVTINANNNTIQRTGAAFYGIFGVQLATLTLNDITVRDGATNSGFIVDAGGVLSANANLIIDNGTFINNQSNFGAGIYVIRGGAQITNSTFTGNGATQVVFDEAGTFSISDSTVDGLGTAQRGVVANNDSTVTISNVSVSNHTIDGVFGGPIILAGPMPTVNITGSNIFGNNNGINVYSGSTISVTGTTITGNTDDCNELDGTIIGDGSNTSPDADCLS